MNLNFKRIVHTLLSYLLLGCVMAVFMPPIFLLLLLPDRWRYDSKILFTLICWCYAAVIKCTLLPVEFVGEDNLPDEPAIFVANHQSSLDIPLLGRLACKRSHVWLAKQELTDSWFFRFILPRVGVLVDASNRHNAMRSLIQVIKLIDNDHGRHAMIFPEGGRFTDGTVHEFFGGFVILAKKVNRPVVPVRIFGVNRAYPPGVFLIQWAPIKVVIGKPLILHPDETDEAFKERVYRWFVEQK